MADNSTSSSFSPLYVLRGHRAPVQCLSLSTANHTPLLYSGDAEGAVCIWDLHQRRAVHTQQVHDSNAGIIQVHVVHQLHQLLAQGRDGQLSICQIRPDGQLGSEPLYTLGTGAFSFCRCAVLQPSAAAPSHTAADQIQPHQDLATLFLGDGPDAEVAAAEAAAITSATQQTATPPSDSPNRSKQLPGNKSTSDALTGTWLAIAAGDAAVVGLWQLGPSTAANTPPSIQFQQQTGSTGPARGMAMAVQLLPNPRGQAAAPVTAVGYESGSVALWDPRMGTAPVAEVRVHEEAVMALALDTQRGRGLSGAADSHLALFEFNLAAGSLTYAMELPLPVAGVADAQLRWDGRVAATAGWDGKIRLWQLVKKPRLAAVGRHHSQQATCVLYDAQQQLLLSGGQDCHIAVWPAVPSQQGPP